MVAVAAKSMVTNTFWINMGDAATLFVSEGESLLRNTAEGSLASAPDLAAVFVDPDDPFPEGYLLSDTWPGDDTQR